MRPRFPGLSSAPRRSPPEAARGEDLLALDDHLGVLVWRVDRGLDLALPLAGGLARGWFTGGEITGMTLPNLLEGFEFQSSIMSAHRRALAGESWMCETRRGRRTYVVSVQPLVGLESQINGVVGVAFDVTDINSQVDVSAAIAEVLTRADGWEETVNHVLAVACTELGWDAAGLWLVDEQPNALRRAALQVGERSPSPGDSDQPSELALGEGLPGTAWATGTPQWVSDSPKALQPSWGDGAFRAGCALPLALSDKVIGILEVSAVVERHVDQPALLVLGAVANQLALYLGYSDARDGLASVGALCAAVGVASSEPVSSTARSHGHSASAPPPVPTPTAQVSAADGGTERPSVFGRETTDAVSDLRALVEEQIRRRAVAPVSAQLSSELTSLLAEIVADAERGARASTGAMKARLEGVGLAASTAVQLHHELTQISDARPLALVVDDLPDLRTLVRQLLEKRGYLVLEASDGPTALGLVDRYAGLIDLLVTDIMMPGMTGPAMVTRLGRAEHQMRILYISAYADGSAVHVSPFGSEIPLLQKPFTIGAFLDTVAELTSDSSSSWHFRPRASR
jgi:CheY-like chemotaxis protein/putative methionine-R-sulfoxide reductase with GAF domain